jgi:hypothetical protein
MKSGKEQIMAINCRYPKKETFFRMRNNKCLFIMKTQWTETSK